jgi:hypothetical protein
VVFPGLAIMIGGSLQPACYDDLIISDLSTLSTLIPPVSLIWISGRWTSCPRKTGLISNVASENRAYFKCCLGKPGLFQMLPRKTGLISNVASETRAYFKYLSRSNGIILTMESRVKIRNRIERLTIESIGYLLAIL